MLRRNKSNALSIAQVAQFVIDLRGARRANDGLDGRELVESSVELGEVQLKSVFRTQKTCADKVLSADSRCVLRNDRGRVVEEIEAAESQVIDMAV